MTIDILSRIRYPQLYNRMRASAKAMAYGPVNFRTMLDDGGPKLAESYNLLAAVSDADVLVFAHDDIIFESRGWDRAVLDALDLGFNLVGAVGTKKYSGGLIFDSGRAHAAGKVIYRENGERVVKLMTNRSEIEPVEAVDGMFLAVDRKHFLAIGGFDTKFDGLFYYDTDLCLRSNCAVVDILLAHEKPANLRGVYPEGMKPIEAYRDQFNAKHGFKSDPPIGDQRCDSMKLSDYQVPA